MGHKYEYEIELGDGSAPDRVVRMVGSAKRVLDIGAGPGSIARVLSQKFKCSVAAVETDDEVIPRLASACDVVYRVDLNDPSWPDALKDAGRFDVVLAADVLEHLYDPWRALSQMRGLIERNGSIVMSLPHAGYCGIVASLVDEDLQYRESGLLDATHLRFFGIKNMEALIENAGLRIVGAEFVIRKPEDTEFAGVWERTPNRLRRALIESRFSFVYQVVVKAVGAVLEGPSVSLFDFDGPDLEPQVNEVRSVEALGGSLTEPGTSTYGIEGERFGGNVRLIAFFLTQFHPIPENDRWWGKGFTEWTNVTKALPLFEGHYQPRLPTDLGFYDLRLRDVRHEQIALAQQYGIYGFCYHYYWFSGTRLLNRPLDDMLNDPESTMPFCLCWANENWTRRWDGIDHEVLLRQTYRPEDDLKFIESVVPLLVDSRYIRLNGAPFLIVYEPQRLPDPLNTVEVWRDYCKTVGVGPIHLCAALTNDNEGYAKFGFDSGVQFPPHNHRCTAMNNHVDFYTPFHGAAVEYSALGQSYLDREYPDQNVFRTVSPSWDQTARVGSRAFLTLNGTPRNYEYWLAESIRRTLRDFPQEERYVFINAWNEWAEGCYLEPDRKYGRQFLEATLRARDGRSQKTFFEDSGLPGPSVPLTGQSVRMAELRRELVMERGRLQSLEAELSEERRRLASVYQDVSTGRLRTSTGSPKVGIGPKSEEPGRAPANGSLSRKLARSLREAVAFFRD